MKLEQSFEVQAPLERVWRALIDLEHVAPCLPGAAVTGRNDDGSYSGVFTVKIGPTSASYAGTLTIDSINEQVHVASLHAHGHDRRGQGSAKATIFSTCSPTPSGGTRVEVITEYFITGRLARFGRGGMIEDISERLLREFAQRLQASLAPAPHEVLSVPAPPKELAPWQRIAAAALDVRDAPPPAAGDAPNANGLSDPTIEAPSPTGRQNGDAPARTEVSPKPSAPPGSALWDQLKRNPGTAGFVAGVALTLLARRRGS